MTEFEYITALTSIIVALAAANVLASLAETIKHRKVTQWFWVHSAWCVTLFYQLVASWWNGWRSSAESEGLSVLQFFVQCFFLALFYVASTLLRPNFASASMDLERHYFEIKTPLFICLLAIYLPGVVLLPIFGSPTDTLVVDLIGTSLIVALSVLGIASKSPRIHGMIVVLWFATFVVIEEIQGGL